MSICPICDFRIGNDRLMSALGTTPICDDCFLEKAERPETIHDAYREARKSEGGLALLQDLLAGATVHVGVDEGFLSLRDYEIRMSEQQLVIIDDGPTRDEFIIDEATLYSVTQRILEISDEHAFQMSFPARKQRRRGIIGWLAFAFGMKWSELNA